MTGKALLALTEYFGNDRRRVSHALKVFACARMIAENEGLSGEETACCVLAAIFHDVGIKAAEDRFGTCTRRQQEELGPPIAAELLAALGVERRIIDRVSLLIGHHHQSHFCDDRDFRALIEADFLVNYEEGEFPLADLPATVERCFATATGKRLAKTLFGEIPERVDG
ncbi:MAG: HD domain-containing protein [Treponema sp.]|jgi:hypothetical protein|nr:HD domain-containing protein [Treponema sp.]